ncbi:MAG: hypothetical protein WC661_10180 [Opitutaceae bacterium]
MDTPSCGVHAINAGLREVTLERLEVGERFENRSVIPDAFRLGGAQLGSEARMQGKGALVGVFHRFGAEEDMRADVTQKQITPDEGANLRHALAGVSKRLIHEAALGRGDAVEPDQLRHGERTGKPHLLAANRDGVEFAERVDHEAVETHEPVEERIESGLILTGCLGGQGEGGAPFHELVSAYVPQAIPARFPQDATAARGGVAGVLW